jgi:glycosyltransferase involved in cell wall biosynthesis
VLLDAFARVQTPEARLVLAGDGSERAKLAAQATRLGIAERVHFVGLRDDVDAFLDEVDVAAMSSDFEGTPLFGFECMAAGTPLVATAVGGLPDMLDHGQSALLVPPRDPAALASALDELLADRPRGAALAAAARERLEGFEIGAVAARYAELYERLLEARRR